MGRDFVKSTGNRIDLGTDIIGSVIDGASQVCAAAWVYADTLGTNSTENVICGWAIAGTSGSPSAGGMFAITNQVGTKGIQLAGRSQTGDTFKSGVADTALSTGQWYHVGGVWDYPNDELRYYLNGVADGTDAVTFGATTYNQGSPSTAVDRIGCGVTLGTGQQFDGRIAELAIWNVDIGAAGFAQLAAGVLPRRLSAMPVFYWPLVGSYSPEIEVIRGQSATITGTIAQGDHPRIFQPRRRQVSPPAAAVAAGNSNLLLLGVG